MMFDELEKNIKYVASNGNVGKYYTWQQTAEGILIWLQDEEGHTVGSQLLKKLKKA